MYKVVKQLVKNGKRIGFVITDGTRQYNVSDNDIINKIGILNISNLGVDNRGFKLKGGRISNLDKVHITSTPKRLVKKSFQFDYYTGDSLIKLIKSQISILWRERDITKVIKSYLLKPSIGRILAISGLRGTGKTVAILQSLNNICKSDYSQAIFINIRVGANITVNDLMADIEPLIADKKYVVIDEATRLSRLITESEELYNRIRLRDKALILSGTDSLAVSLSTSSGLHHRLIDKNITFISFRESVKTLNFNLQQYIKMGGLYKANRIESLAELLEYTDTSIIDNLLNTFNRNIEVRNRFLGSMEDVKLRNIVYKLIYGIVYQGMLIYDKKEHREQSRFFRVINLFEDPDGIYTKSDLNTILCEQLGIQENWKVTKAEISSVLEMLKRAGLVIEIPNVLENGPSKFYLTNPSMVNQVYLSIYRALQNQNLERTKRTIKSVNGAVFESCIICHAYKVAKENGLYIGYFANKSNREIDLIVANKIEDTWDSAYTIYYEIKLTSSMEEDIARTKWLNSKDYKENEERPLSDNSRLIERYIIYNGDEQTFTGFTDKSLIRIDYTGETVDTIEKLNIGTKLINGSKFMLDTKSYLQRLIDMK